MSTLAAPLRSATRSAIRTAGMQRSRSSNSIATQRAQQLVSQFAAAANVNSNAVQMRAFSSSAQTSSAPAAAGSAGAAGNAGEQARMVLSEKRDNVAILTLNRPKALNALCNELITQLNAELRALDADENVGCIIITGSEKAFAAGADIKEMANQTFITAYRSSMLAFWHDLTLIRKPIIAAVNGFALGGGCELAMMCDIIIAGDKARFGQPEIVLGTIPGCGGTQRLTRAVGKSKAMEWCLTGEHFTADQAERAGLVSRVVPAGELLNEAVKTATKIASMSKPIAALVKDAVNASYETTLQQGVIFERRLFYATFATADQKEGMKAFVEKRKPTFTDK